MPTNKTLHPFFHSQSNNETPRARNKYLIRSLVEEETFSCPLHLSLIFYVYAYHSVVSYLFYWTCMIFSGSEN